MLPVWIASIVLMNAPAEFREIVVTQDTVLTAADVAKSRIVIKASHVTLDGNGLELIGPGKPGDLASFEKAGPGVLAEGVTNVTIKNLKVRGFETGIELRKCLAPVVEDCELSFNYSNPDFNWGELPPRGGLILDGVRMGVFRKNKANYVWDAVSLRDSDDNLFLDNDFSHTSNTCAKLWNSSRNKFLNNDLSYGIRIDRPKGEVHARDSTSVLIESGSDDNTFYRNDIRHGGDGIFIRPLNGWISKGNVFIENDTSFANNNCVESWSPGNVYIRNIANRGSYGFWLGGSDDTMLIGNEASYNGLESGYHNAPEPIFAHGGIVIVGGTSSHTRIEGNKLVGNNGGGIVFRGDVGSKGATWSTLHWVVQQNVLKDNKWPIWGRYGDWIVVGPNEREGNANLDSIEDTQNLSILNVPEPALRAPTVKLVGPERAVVGEFVDFDASGTTQADGLPIEFAWRFGDEKASGAKVRHRFTKPGFVRVGVTATAGGLSDIAYRNVLVSEKVAEELGTENGASGWTGEQDGVNAPKAGLVFVDAEDSVVGNTSLHWTPNPYNGAMASVVFPADKKADWNLSAKTKLVFWIKALNPNIPAFQNAGPVIRLRTDKGEVRLQPTKDRNLYVNMGMPSESRHLWMRIEIPLAGDAEWERKEEGKPDLKHVRALSLGMDSWGGEPFEIWLDGLRFE